MYRLQRYFSSVLYMREMVIGKRLHGNVFKVIAQNLLFRAVIHVILFDFHTDTDALTRTKFYFRSVIHERGDCLICGTVVCFLKRFHLLIARKRKH